MQLDTQVSVCGELALSSPGTPSKPCFRSVPAVYRSARAAYAANRLAMAFIRESEKPTGTRFYVYWREHGSQKARVFRDRPTAEAFLAEKDGTPPDPAAIPFDQFWRRYVDSRASRKLTPKVAKTYEAMGWRLLLPYFKDRPLNQIGAPDIEAWIRWAEQQAGPGTVQEAYTTLCAVFTYAKRLALIPYFVEVSVAFVTVVEPETEETDAGWIHLHHVADHRGRGGRDHRHHRLGNQENLLAPRTVRARS